MRTNAFLWFLVALGVVAPLAAVPQKTADDSAQWRDNERQFRSDDPKYNFRRSQHFCIAWGKGVGDGNTNNDFGGVTEQLVQGNLQMLEQVLHHLHEVLGFRAPGKSNNGKVVDAFRYRDTIVMNNTGIWEGGAWGACDDWGLPLFALPPSYLRFDPPSGATPHEYGHTVLISAGGSNDTPWDGMWHEATGRLARQARLRLTEPASRRFSAPPDRTVAWRLQIRPPRQAGCSSSPGWRDRGRSGRRAWPCPQVRCPA